MRFADPNFLWALWALLIPVLIHLLRFHRFRRIQFSDLSLLRQIETQSKRSRRLRKWLILLSRMLALAALVVAFARPYIRGAEKQAHSGKTWIQIDNSFSMLRMGEQGPLFEQAKVLARELVRVSSAGERFMVWSNRSSLGGWMPPDEAIAAIDALVVESAPNTYAPMLNERSDQGAEGERAVILSDFQLHGDLEFDSLQQLHLLPLESGQDANISIDSLWLDQPALQSGETQTLRFQLSNHGGRDAEAIAVRLVLNGRQEAAQSVDVPARSSRNYSLRFSPSEAGWLSGVLEIDDPYMSFDNAYYFSLRIKEKHRVLLISEGEAVSAAIFERDPLFEPIVRKADELDPSDLRDVDMILIDGPEVLGTAQLSALREALSQGAVLLLVPGTKGGDLAASLGGWSWGEAQDKALSVAPPSLEDPFFNGVFSSLPNNLSMPKVQRLFTMPMDRLNALLWLKDGSPVFGMREIGAGKLYQLALPLNPEWSELAETELWVVCVLRSLFSGLAMDDLAYAMDRSEPISINAPYAEDALELTNDRNTWILEKGWSATGLRFWLNSEIQEAGTYRVRYKESDRYIRPVSLNFSRRESSGAYGQRSDLQAMFGSNALIESSGDEQVVSKLVERSAGLPLWKHFVVLCLIFILIEILLLRFTKS